MAIQTLITGSTGTATCAQPFQDAEFKKVIVYLDGYSDTATQIYTFPTAFTQMPVMTMCQVPNGDPQLTQTSITFNTQNSTGYILIEGY